MIYFADLHVHSKFSRATSKDCDIARLAAWACLKGIKVIATGDFTHPGWQEEIKNSLVEAEDGLLRLRDGLAPEVSVLPGGFGPSETRFILNGEISSIYKKNGATRRVHNLVFMPDLDAMERFGARLDKIGNIRSDGRPIIGLDSRDLLEIALETTEESFLVPAHIWTPWFSLLGSKSGFDSVEECFEDLAGHIFALETGLSSDPEMNHRLSALDRYSLVSSSDTHSPARLGREASIFRGAPGYSAIREALRQGGSWIRNWAKTVHMTLDADSLCAADATGTLKEEGFLGTLEFFPEEGKYHLDGHRKCEVRLQPEETEKLGGICPKCGRPVTVGGMNRVRELADRPSGMTPPGAAPFWRLIPLPEIVGQALDVGPASKKAQALHMELLSKLGPELQVLWATPLEEVARHAPAVVTEGLRRVRAGEVSIDAGFDGEYGSVSLFGAGEREHFQGQGSLLPVQKVRTRKASQPTAPRPKRTKAKSLSQSSEEKPAEGLNPEQTSAITCLERPVLIQAGPGTGKTRTLVHRAAYIIEKGQVAPQAITAVTFTRKAANEMKERLEALLSADICSQCWVGTFHQLGARILETSCGHGTPVPLGRVLDQDEASSWFRAAMRGQVSQPAAQVSTRSLADEVSRLKQTLTDVSDPTISDGLRAAYATYESALAAQGSMDLDDLLVRPVRLLQSDNGLQTKISALMGSNLLVDEFQDVNRAQYEMIRLLAPQDGKGLFLIGDPDQAIYGFRGSDTRFFSQFVDDYPSAVAVRLVRNYRSLPGVIRASETILDGRDPERGLMPQLSGQAKVSLARLPNQALESEFIARSIDSMLGGTSFYSVDSRDLFQDSMPGLGFGDIAVLYRLNSVGDELERNLRESGIPVQRARKSSPQEESEALDPRAQAVTLMTIHAAKGQEFRVVFVAGCEEGVIPYLPVGPEQRTDEEIEEERRLLYVAMTRAKERLFLTWTPGRVLHGRKQDRGISRFLQAADRKLFDVLDPLRARRPRTNPKQYDLFGSGEH